MHGIANKKGLEIIEQLGLFLNQIVILSDAGSTLYGTTTPESDRDYLGIYIPTEKQLLLNEYPKHVSLPKDSGLDCQMWSIHYFLKLACQGETMAIDLTHANPSNFLIWNPIIWDFIKNNRTRFYTKGMKSFVSYARKQAAKYGIKGTRIEALETVIDYLENYSIKGIWDEDDIKLKHLWDTLPKGEHIHFLDTKPYRMYQVAGKKFQETVKIAYIKDHLKKSLNEYGNRAILARENKGVDWKGISHAIRSADQVYDILRFGDFDFPLRTAAFIRNVKMGKLDFIDVVQPYLEESMNDLEKLMEASELPDEVDREYWNGWVIHIMKEHVLMDV